MYRVMSIVILVAGALFCLAILAFGLGFGLLINGVHVPLLDHWLG
jgi:hypothetical protein